MAFTYAYSLDNGSGAPTVVDYDLTAAATYTPAIGELVKFDSNGKVVGKHVVGDAASTKVGVSVGSNFLGLATSGANAATTSSIYNPAAVGKIIADPNAVYRVNLKTSDAILVGTAYGIATVSGDQQLDSAATAANNKFVVVDFDISAQAKAASIGGNGFAFVTIPVANRIYSA